MADTLTAAQGIEVVRYWAAAVRHAEGLACRLRVEPSRPPGAVVDVLNPDWGARYAKLLPGPDAEDPIRRLLLREASTVSLPVTGELAGLFEGWLRFQYRVSMYRAMGIPTDTGDDGWFVGFPVLHDRARAELDVLLRVPVRRLEWRGADGSAWSPPSYATRRKGDPVAPPATLRLSLEPHEAGTLPFAVSELVLSRALGVNEDDLSAFLEKLEPVEARTTPAVLDALCALLDAQPGPPLERLTAACNGRIAAGSTRAWPVGVLFDGSRQAPTAGLLGELRELVDDPDLMERDSPLRSYLTGERPNRVYGVVRTLQAPVPLTAEQREAVEGAASPLSACQGPPGTGKTRLVVALLADAVVESAARIEKARDGWPRPSLTVVASTNNRAVDTALEPLEPAPGRLGVTWRIGNQEVVTTVACARLEQTLAWLDDEEVQVLPLAEARRRFTAALGKVQGALGPMRARRRERERAESLDRRLASAEELVAEVTAALAALPEDREEVPGLAEAEAAIVDALKVVERLLDHLSVGHAGRARKAAKKLLLKALPKTTERLLAVGYALPVALPDLEPFSEDLWEDGAEALSDELEAAQTIVGAKVSPARERRRLTGALESSTFVLDTLRAERAALVEGAEVDAGAVYDQTVGARAALYEAACALRESWAREERDALAPVLAGALAALRDRGTPSRVLEDRDAARALLTLFPAVGCTLLSMRASFPLDAGVIDRLIVDEAGQCHPAYVVPALLRAKSALIIGDTHQLEPIVETDDAEEARALKRSGCTLAPDKLQPYRVLARRPISAQTLAERATGYVVSLRDHFRCQGPIIAISDRLCRYDLRVRTEPRSFGDRVPWLASPVVLIPARGEQVADGGSWRNDGERDALLQALAEVLEAGVAASEIAVLTPYRGQLASLRRGVRRLLGGRGGGDEWAENADEGGVALGTVHRFQGGERDVVLLSTVITRDRSLPFMNQRVNLVNVAVSRARVHLVVVGNPDVLSRGAVTRELVRGATVVGVSPLPPTLF